MLVKDKRQLKLFICDLISHLESEREILLKENFEVTSDMYRYTSEDFDAVVTYLKKYIKFHWSRGLMNRKPKGNIFLILSYNEPLVLMVIPVLNALIMGNKVNVKVSRGSEDLFRMIWNKTGIVNKFNLHLELIEFSTTDNIHEFIKENKAVYFFGGLKVAKKIANTCANYFVDFYPEIETTDVKIFDSSNINIEDDVITTLDDSFTHSGQTCQRIQGVFVHNKYFNKYKDVLYKVFLREKKYTSSKFVMNMNEEKKKLLVDINNSNPDDVLIGEDGLPIVVINPNLDSDFVKKAYFLPVFWISGYSNVDDLLSILNKRNFFMGLNLIISDNTKLERFINETPYTRITQNTTHSNVRPFEGWGGSWPSGHAGYVEWTEVFSNKFTIIK